MLLCRDCGVSFSETKNTFLQNIRGAALMKQVKTAANRGVQHYQHWLYATFWQDNPVAEGYLG
jgi:hypothetical protein